MHKDKRELIWSWLPVLVWMAVIFWGSSVPEDRLLDLGIPNADKIAHFAEYFVLGALLVRALSNSGANHPVLKIVFLSLAIAFVYAVSDELHQHFIPGRVPDLLDLVSDIAGSSVAVIIYSKRRSIAEDKAF